MGVQFVLYSTFLPSTEKANLKFGVNSSSKRRKYCISQVKTIIRRMTLQGAAKSDCDCVVEDLLKRPLSACSYNEKYQIVSTGRPTPDLKLLKTKSHGGFERHFSSSWYNDFPWLCGCNKLQKLFCWPCLLFSDKKNTWTTGGINNMNSFRALRVHHENSKTHISSLVSLSKFGKSKIDANLSETLKTPVDKYNEGVKRNRYIMGRLINAVCYLAQQELPFRCSDESDNSDCRGNFVELLHLIAQTDDRLEEHLQAATMFSKTSSDIQNEIIECIFCVVINAIKKEVSETSFISVILDKIIGASDESQLSMILRYVTSEGEVKERFVGFCDISHSTAANLSKCFFELVEKFKCGAKLVAETYDGAGLMPEEHSSLQSIVRQRYRQALFVHCYAHKLNLVLQQSTSKLKKCRTFFHMVSGISTFFCKSPKRTEALDNEMKKHIPSASDKRWNYKSRMIDVIFSLKNELITLFKLMAEDENEWDAETRIYALGYYQNLLSFDFRFLLLVFSLVFPKTDSLFNILQKNMFDVGFCKQNIDDFKSNMSDLRGNFDKLIWPRMECESDQEFHGTAIHSKRLRLGKGEKDEKSSYQQLFYKIIDTVIGQITEMFSDTEQLQFLSLLNGASYVEYDKSFPESAFKTFLMHYGEYFNPMRLRNELCYVYSSPEFWNKPVHEVHLELYGMGLKEALPEVYKLHELILTIPATRASAEQSFSALYRIRTYLRNTQAQHKLSALSLLYVEKAMLRKLQKQATFQDSVIDVFLEKNQRIELKYK